MGKHAPMRDRLKFLEPDSAPMGQAKYPPNKLCPGLSFGTLHNLGQFCLFCWAGFKFFSLCVFSSPTPIFKSANSQEKMRITYNY